MKAKLIRNMPKIERFQRNGQECQRVVNDGHKEGDVIEGHNVYLLVKQGVAEPADEECREAAGMTPERFEAAKENYERTLRGIHPEDFEAYKRGLMTGYKPDGVEGNTWIHGPEWTEGCEVEYYSNLEDEDDNDDE